VARPHPIEIARVLYQVLARANRDGRFFSRTRTGENTSGDLRDIKRAWLFYADVLIKDHVHLLIETPKANLAKIMQGINSTYRQYFDKEYDKVGHPFQGWQKSQTRPKRKKEEERGLEK
jgi:putative transposase